ncbi:MAG: HesA/MoeB/ThiF family protein [Bdellovibrionota bacterium]
MSDPQLNRYLRQTALPEIGKAGQLRLKNSKVLIVGVGGLGCTSSLYLAAAGVGHLGLIDPDKVDESNLQRQVLFKMSDIGRPKVMAARERLNEFNPDITIKTYDFTLTEKNILEVFHDFDLILDGTDNFQAKYLINDAAARIGLPVVYGSISGFEAQISVFWKNHGPCYRCIYPEPPKSLIMSCAEAGVLGAVAGLAGTIQALEAVKLILSGDSTLQALVGKLMIIDTASMNIKSYDVPKRTDCPICSVGQESITIKAIPPQECCATTQAINLDQISAADIKDPSTRSSFILIDVREQAEWETGHIPGALNVPLSQIEKGLAPVLNKSQQILLYCQKGIRSQHALTALRKLGFLNLKQLRSGLGEWDGELEKGSVAALQRKC